MFPSLRAEAELPDVTTPPLRGGSASVEVIFASIQVCLDRLCRREEVLVEEARRPDPPISQDKHQRQQWMAMRDAWAKANQEIMGYLLCLPYEDQSKLVAWLARQTATHHRWCFEGPDLAIHYKFPYGFLHLS